jgi:hypothetical protein
MAKAIITQRASNDEAARLADEALGEGSRDHPKRVRRMPKTVSEWKTVTVELQFEGGKMKTIRHNTNRTMKASERYAATGNC